MGVTASEYARKDAAEATWDIPHEGVGSPWSLYALRRYGSGFAATGVSSSIALPKLMRHRVQDWHVHGLSFYMGSDWISFGRSLESLSKPGNHLYYGVDVIFSEHSRTSALWFCKPQEWLLRLHKAVIEPLPTPPPPAIVAAVGPGRWPGQPRYLLEERPSGAAAPAGSTGGTGAADEELASEPDPATADDGAVASQLSLYLSNADGHVGLLSIPVMSGYEKEARDACERWAKLEVPLVWGGRQWKTDADFVQLRETALNMPDLLLLALETELAAALTPDWTWEKYPRGYGEVALIEDSLLEDEEEESSAFPSLLPSMC